MRCISCGEKVPVGESTCYARVIDLVAKGRGRMRGRRGPTVKKKEIKMKRLSNAEMEEKRVIRRVIYSLVDSVESMLEIVSVTEVKGEASPVISLGEVGAKDSRLRRNVKPPTYVISSSSSDSDSVVELKVGNEAPVFLEVPMSPDSAVGEDSDLCQTDNDSEEEYEVVFIQKIFIDNKGQKKCLVDWGPRYETNESSRVTEEPFKNVEHFTVLVEECEARERGERDYEVDEAEANAKWYVRQVELGNSGSNESFGQFYKEKAENRRRLLKKTKRKLLQSSTPSCPPPPTKVDDVGMSDREDFSSLPNEDSAHSTPQELGVIKCTSTQSSVTEEVNPVETFNKEGFTSPRSYEDSAHSTPPRHIVIESMDYPQTIDTEPAKPKAIPIKPSIMGHDSPESKAAVPEDDECNVPGLKQSLAIKNSCDLCGKVFSTKDSRNRHRRTLHLNDPRLTKTPKQRDSAELNCPDCPKRFGSRSALSRHRVTHREHAPTYTCQKCQKPFARKSSMVNHKCKK